MSKIMFRGREVVEVKEQITGSCHGCVGIEGCESGEFKHPSGCSARHTIYVYAKPPLDVFVDQAAKNYFFFAGKLHTVDFSSGRYSSRRVAIRGAKRFCAKIGFECRIKGDK